MGARVRPTMVSRRLSPPHLQPLRLAFRVSPLRRKQKDRSQGRDVDGAAGDGRASRCLLESWPRLRALGQSSPSSTPSCATVLGFYPHFPFGADPRTLAAMCPLDRRFSAGISIPKEPQDGHGGGVEAIARENGAVPAATDMVDGVLHVDKFFKFPNWFIGLGRRSVFGTAKACEAHLFLFFGALQIQIHLAHQICTKHRLTKCYVETRLNTRLK